MLEKFLTLECKTSHFKLIEKVADNMGIVLWSRKYWTILLSPPYNLDEHWAKYMLYLPSWCLRVGSRIPAKHVQVFVELWYTHSRNVWSLFIWITVVVTVTITHKTADVRQQNPLSLICKVQMFESCRKNICTLVYLVYNKYVFF